MSKDKNKLIPELRFPEFANEEEWEEKAFEELFEIGNGRDYKHLGKGDIPVYGSGGYMLSVNDFLYDGESVCIGRKGTIDKPMFLRGKFWTVDTLFYTHSFKDCLPKYIHYVFQNIDWLKHNEAGGVPSLSKTNIHKIKSLVPKLPEQQKIASCLSSLDELIATHIQKLELLKGHKKGLMQNLFPKEGEKVPKYRFPEFEKDGEWKINSVGKILKQVFRPVKMSDNKNYSLVTVKRRYGGVVSRGILKGDSILVKSQFFIQENDFLISKRQIVHCACGVVPEHLKGSIVSNEYSVLVPIGENSVEFINYFSQQQIVGQSFLTCSIGVVIEKMLFKIDDWLKMEFLFPSPDEQRKIASCFSSLDALITAQEGKIEQLKMHKKGLMQGLFPKIDN